MATEWPVAEYVLGSLDAEERAAVTAALREDAELRAERDAWERRLAPLQSLAPPRTPPSGLWEAISRQLGWAESVPSRRSWWSIPGLAGALASVLALVLISTFRPAEQAVEANWSSIEIAVEERTLWTARWLPEQPARLELLGEAASALDGDQDYQLWIILAGDPQPQALGLMPRQAQTRLQVGWPGPREGAALAVSLEPRGGSRQLGPSGPVVAVVPLDAT
ncbi:MAG: anti-sigma factor [Oceanococcaceae bacterium]